MKFKEVSEKFWSSNRLSWKLFCFLLMLLPHKTRVGNSCDLSLTVYCANHNPLWDESSFWLCSLVMPVGTGSGEMNPWHEQRSHRCFYTNKDENREPTCKFDETACKFNETGAEAGIFRFRSLRENSVDEWSWAVSCLSTGSWAPSCESIYTQTTEPIRGIQTNTKNWWASQKQLMWHLTKLILVSWQGNDNISTHWWCSSVKTTAKKEWIYSLPNFIILT